jgi:hypothetical protein
VGNGKIMKKILRNTLPTDTLIAEQITYSLRMKGLHFFSSAIVDGTVGRSAERSERAQASFSTIAEFSGSYLILPTSWIME